MKTKAERIYTAIESYVSGVITWNDTNRLYWSNPSGENKSQNEKAHQHFLKAAEYLKKTLDETIKD